jgi:hypothetical protein
MQLAQLTDLHFRYHLPVDDERAPWCDATVEALRDGLKTLRGQSIDWLVLTGDLVDVPKDAALAPAGSVDADYKLLKSMIDDIGLPYVVLPGNHDADGPMWSVFERGEDVFDAGGFRFARFCDHEDAAHVPHRSKADRARFEQLLSTHGSPPQVHLQHFVIAPPLDAGYPYNYADASALAEAMTGAGCVSLCLSGHYHPGVAPFAAGGTTFSVAPAASKPPYPWRLYELTATGVRCTDGRLSD